MSEPNWSNVITRAKSDSDFRSRLIADPASACNEVGCRVPHGTDVQVIQQSPNQFHLMLGAKGYAAEIDSMLDRAVNDTEFKGQLLDDPITSVESAIGEKLPAGLEVVVHEKKPGQVFLFLDSAGASGELSEQELDAVAGGSFGALIRDMFCRNSTRTVTTVSVVNDKWVMNEQNYMNLSKSGEFSTD